MSVPSVGGYCFSGLSGTPTNVQVTPAHTFSGPIIANATIGQSGSCPAGTQVTVVLTSAITGGTISSPFYIEIN